MQRVFAGLIQKQPRWNVQYGRTVKELLQMIKVGLLAVRKGHQVVVLRKNEVVKVLSSHHLQISLKGLFYAPQSILVIDLVDLSEQIFVRHVYGK